MKRLMVLGLIAIFATSCSQASIEALPDEDPPDNNESESTDFPLEVHNLENYILHAEDNVRLVNLWAEENKEYKKWVDEQFFSHLSRPDRNYLSEYTYILEEDFKLFHVNEQTGEKIMILEGERIEGDITDETQRDFEEVYFYGNIDEYKIVYRKVFDQWGAGCGIFDLSDFSDHPISVAGEDRYVRGIFGEYVYTLGGVRYTKTNVNNYETTGILIDFPQDGGYTVTDGFSPDGKTYASRLQAYDKDVHIHIDDAFDVEVYDVDKGGLLSVFNIFVEKTNTEKRQEVSFFWLYYKDNNTICVIERDLKGSYGVNTVVIGHLYRLGLDICSA